MKVVVRYFASLREALGPREEIEVFQGITVGQVRDQLIGQDGAHAEALRRERLLRCAIDQTVCEESAVVPPDGAELAFFPPVTGG